MTRAPVRRNLFDWNALAAKSLSNHSKNRADAWANTLDIIPCPGLAGALHMVRTETPICDFGKAAIPFRLPDADGRTWSLDDVMGKHGLLVMFICNHCPYVKAIRDKLVRDTRDLAQLGVGAVAIMSNDYRDYPEDAPEEMTRVARECGFPFPYLIDFDQSVAQAYGAVCTPDFFGYNDRLELQYRGRLDSAGSKADVPDAPRELYEAMKQVARTGQGPAVQTPSIGCSIKWKND